MISKSNILSTLSTHTNSKYGWQLGQCVKFSFKTPLTLNGFNIKIWSDKNGGWKEIATIQESDLITTKPYLELVCIDSVDKIFDLEIIR